MHNDFYTGKHILVTGVAGVKGSWLALALLRAGASVIGVDRRVPDLYSNFTATGLEKRIEFIKGDVTDLELMKMLASRVDGLFHLAAVAVVREAREHPFDTYASNTLGVAAVLEAIRTAQRPLKAVFITTDKVYSPKAGEPWVESDTLIASGPYAVSKGCAEFVIADYQRTYFEKSAHLIGVGRAGNVVIGGDFYSSRRTGGGGRIFVDCCEALAEGRQPEIFTPTFTRPYTYGCDIVSGYMTLMARLDQPGIAGQAFNFGPREGYGVSNAALAAKICELWGTGVTWQSGTAREEPFEFQSLSIRKSDDLLDWRPAYSLDQTLRDTIRWYREWAKLGDSATPGCMYSLDLDLLEDHANAAREMGISWAKP